ncbi:MAG: hypothetical protein CVV27_07845 [Candidatus Melainabacteria bacterium HGW-Melainabacteria-1]|nr:MAG: hypothetical protein CVV27_07845 [Candidatus Melainabacteria bacterium HGW-Melainabacteria-1]
MSRSISELGLTTVEQQRMLRNNNVITTKFMSEKDARSSEMRELNDKAVDLEFKKIAAEKSKEAAKWGMIGAALNLLGTAIKGAAAAGGSRGANFSWAELATDAVNGVGTLITKVLDFLKAGAEEKSIKEDLERLNGQRTQTDAATQALDSNPYG